MKAKSIYQRESCQQCFTALYCKRLLLCDYEYCSLLLSSTLIAEKVGSFGYEIPRATTDSAYFQRAQISCQPSFQPATSHPVAAHFIPSLIFQRPRTAQLSLAPFLTPSRQPQLHGIRRNIVVQPQHQPTTTQNTTSRHQRAVRASAQQHSYIFQPRLHSSFCAHPPQRHQHSAATTTHHAASSNHLRAPLARSLHSLALPLAALYA